jgi:alpha-D-ribose 1-methylphosphonate 5-triphosphate diphosphatase
MTPTILTNAKLILEDEVVTGTIVFDEQAILNIDSGRSQLASAIDVQGDYVMPGIIEMHTDNMEKHFVPRPKVFWPDALAAAVANDAQMAAAGITTVYDSVSCGSYGSKGYRTTLFPIMLGSIEHGVNSGAFRVDHHVHLRCEIPAENIIIDLEPHLDKPIVKLASLMDHTPGQRQWRNLDHLRTYNLGAGEQTADQFEDYIKTRIANGPKMFEQNWPRVVSMFQDRNILLATHDDTTENDVDLGIAAGAKISEFPTTPEAARYARKSGLSTVAGAPNVVRGGSHSGGVSATELALNDMLDGLSSDYVPSALLQAVMVLHANHHMPLPQAAAMVTRNMADMLSLKDRGRLTTGLRSDILHFGLIGPTPIVRTVWSAGKRAF